MTVKPLAFERKSFEEGLRHIPDSVIFEMAKDGRVCPGEVLRILQMMKLSPEQMQAAQLHQHTIARLVLRYAGRQMHMPVDRQLCQVTGRQAADIMRDLLDRGLIDKYMTHVSREVRSQQTPHVPGMEPQRTR